MNPSAPLLSVVMPVYNEMADIQSAIDEVQEEVFSRVPDSNLIVVDDGSTDGTEKILADISAREKRIQVHHVPNGGHGKAVVKGVDLATGDFVLLIDSDRQIPLTAFVGLWSQRDAAKAILGVRRERQDPPLRMVLTRIVRAANRILFGVELKDANAPFKLFRREIWAAFRPLISDQILAPSLFLAIFVKKAGIPMIELAVPHRPRLHGVSKIRHLKLLRFCSLAFYQLLSFRIRLK